MTPMKQTYVAVSEEERDEPHSTTSSSPLKKIKNVLTQYHGHWQPFTLRPIGLILFASILLCILAALLAIWVYARGRHGLNLVTTNHYTWTYGPTAIFILVVSYWRLVDYHTKALTPWSELASGPTTADRSILLDYVSPLLAESLFLAMRRGHVAVFMSILGFLVLKVVTIASTGLFFPEFIIIGPFEQQMRQTSQLNTVSNFSDFSDPGASPFYEAYAIMHLGLPLAEGLTNEFLYETYRPVEDANANSTYLVRSRAFAPNVTCETVDIEPIINWDEFGSTVSQSEQLRVRNSSTWTCPNKTSSAESTLNLKVTDVASRLAPARQLLSSFGTFDCLRSTPLSEDTTPPYLIALSDVRYNQIFNVSTANVAVGDLIEPTTWDFSVPRITGMLCTVDYNVVDVNILYNMSLGANPAQSIEVIGLADPPRIANVSNEYLSRKLGYADPGSLGGARDMFGLFSQFEHAEEPPQTVLTMVAQQVSEDYKYLIDHPESFLNATEYVLNNMILQIAKKFIILEDTNSTFVPREASGQESHYEERLVVQTTSFAIVSTGLAILLLITLATLAIRPNPFTVTSPEAITTNVQMLRASEDLNVELQHLAHASEKSAGVHLGQTMYHRDSANSNIMSYSVSHASPPQNTQLSVSQKGYAPLTLSKFCITLTLVSAPVAIGVLEALQHLSDSNFPGIATVSTTSSFVISIYSRFLPALIALLIATMYNCLDFNMAMLSPYNHLASARGSYAEFGTPILAHIAPVAILTALRRRYWAASLAGLGALVGSVLTIVVSGLYTVDNIPSLRDISVTEADSWNMSYIQGLRTDNGATAVSSLIESANLSYPQFTYNELVFPTLDANEGSSGNVAIEIPALRADLVCEEIPWESSNASFGWKMYKTTGYSAITFNVTVPLPETCHYGSCYGNESSIRPVMPDATITDGNTSYYGQAIDLHTGPWRADEEDCDIFFTSYGDVDTDQTINQPGCPSILLTWGYFDGNDFSRNTWTSMLCEQRVQQVSTSLTVSLPESNIVLDPIPTPDESTASYLDSGDNGEKAFGWWLNGNMDWSYIMFNESAIDPLIMGNDTSVSNEVHAFSNFFRGSFFGKTPLALKTLEKNDTDSKELVLKHINMFYRRYMAQYFSSNLRVYNGSNLAKRDDRLVTPSPVIGSFTPEAGVPRLIQHRTPKLVLQAMLAFMFVCAALALWLGRYHNLVLWNPCTIAGIMVLFAGSKICESEDTSKTASANPMKQTVRVNDREVSRGPGYEMINFSKPRATDREDEAASNPFNEKNGTLHSAQSSASGREWKNEHATYRLGWWRDGVFVGPKKGLDVVVEGDKWRYGIDVL